MDNDSAFLQELCYYANERNKLNLSRHRSRYKKQYWQKVLLSLKEINSLPPNSTRKKRRKIGPLKIRSNILKYGAEQAHIRHLVMEFTLSTTKRVRELIKLLRANIKYNNGSVESIFLRKIISEADGTRYSTNFTCTSTMIEELAHQFELNKNIEQMLE